MKRIVYIFSIFLCSLILIGLFFSLPVKAEVTGDPNTWDPADLLTPSNPSVEISQPANGATYDVTQTSNIPISFTNKNFKSAGANSLHYIITARGPKGLEIIYESADMPLVGDDDQHTHNWVITDYESSNYTIEIETTSDNALSVISSVTITLTGGPSASTSPSSSVTPAPGSTTTPTQSSIDATNLFLGSLNTSNLSKTLTGGKTLVQTINPATNTSGEKFWIFQVWRFCMSLINSVMVAFLIFLAFVNILRIQMDTYAIKKILPTLVLAVILANFSLLICRAVVDFSDVLVNTFVVDKKQLAQGLVDALGLFKGNPKITVGVGSLAVLAVFGAAVGAAGLVVILAGIIFALLPGIAILVLAFLLWIRVVVVQVLVAFSPLAFIAMALPMTKTWFARWWGQFANWTFMTVVIFFLLRIVTLIQSATPGKLEIWTLVVAYFVLYIAVQVPFKMGGAIMSAWAGFGKTVAGINKGGWLNEAFGMAAKRVGTASLKSPLGKLVSSGIVNKQLYEASTAKTYEEAINAVWESKYAKVADKMNKGKDLTQEDRRIRAMHGKISAEEAQNYQDISPEGINRILQERLGKTQEEREQTLKDWYNGKLFTKDPKKALDISALITALQKKRYNYMEGEAAQNNLSKISDTLTNLMPSSAGRLDLNATSQVMRVAARPASSQIEGVTKEIAQFNSSSMGKAPLQIQQEFEAQIAPKLSGVKLEDLKNIPFEDLSKEDRALLDQLTKLYEQHGDIATIDTHLSPIISAIVSNPHYLIDKKELFTGAPEELKKELGVLAEGGFEKTQLRANIPNLDLMLENSANLEQVISQEKSKIDQNIQNTLTSLSNLQIPGQTLNIPSSGPITLKQRMEINRQIQTVINDPSVSPEVKSDLKNRQVELDKNFRLSNHAKTADKTLSDLISQHKPAQQAISSNINPSAPQRPKTPPRPRVARGPRARGRGI